MRRESRAASGERGVALAVAVFALAVIGGLVAANFAAGMLEQQSGRNTLFMAQAAEAAEAGLRDGLVLAPLDILATLPILGAPYALGSVSSPGMIVQREVARLTDRLFLLRVRASRIDGDGTPLATRALGLLVKLTADSTGAAAVLPLTSRPWVQLY